MALELQAFADMLEAGTKKKRWLLWLLLTLVLAMIGEAAVFVWTPRCNLGREPDLTNARALEAATVMYRAEHAHCPDFADLRRDMIISSTQHAHDRWGNPYEIVCTKEDSWVESAGPDRKRFTEDDFHSRRKSARRSWGCG